MRKETWHRILKMLCQSGKDLSNWPTRKNQITRKKNHITRKKNHKSDLYVYKKRWINLTLNPWNVAKDFYHRNQLWFWRRPPLSHIYSFLFCFCLCKLFPEYIEITFVCHFVGLFSWIHKSLLNNMILTAPSPLTYLLFFSFVFVLHM